MIDKKRLDAHLNNGEREYIMCAANYIDDGKDHKFKPYNINKGLVYCGWRHSCIFETMPEGTVHGCTQGFLTNKNRFLTRKEGLELVKTNGQLKDDLIGGVLTSEDLW
jgi:hypothetical protein